MGKAEAEEGFIERKPLDAAEYFPSVGMTEETRVEQDGEVNSPLQKRAGGHRMREQGKRSPILVW